MQREEKTAAKKQRIVEDLLKHGKENACTTATLCQLLNMDTRTLQAEIAREREDGAVILSTCQGSGGYYLPSNTEEVQEFIRTLEARGKRTLGALKSAKRYLKQQEGKGGHEQKENTNIQGREL